MNPSISVIIPVHNAGEYLRECVESVLRQSLAPEEVILVVDKPTDGSERTAARLAAEDSRVRLVVHRENLHIGISRNDGLAAATGELVAFVDHDDRCEPEMLRKLYDAMQAAGADLALSPIGETEAGQGATVNDQRPALSERTALLRDTLSQGPADSFNPQTAVVVGGLFKRSLLEGLTFADTRSCSAEDWLFLTEALHRAKRTAWVDETLYLHRRTASNTGSTYQYAGAVSRVNTIAHALVMVRAWSDAADWQEALRMGATKMIVRSLPSIFSKEYKEAIRMYRVQSWLPELFRPELLPPAQGFLGKIYRSIIVTALTKK